MATATVETKRPNSYRAGPDEDGHFGIYGGRFVAETLMPNILELEGAWVAAKGDPAFQAELDSWFKDYVGRPSPLYLAERLTDHLGGARVYFKRDELNHTGAHKINNCVGPDPARRADGQEADHRRDGCGPARRGDGHGGRPLRPRVRDLHGRARHRAASAQRLSDAPAGCQGGAGDLGLADAEGRDERGAARLGDQCRGHLLHHRLGGRPAPLPGPGSRLPEHHRQRGQGTDPGKGGPAARPPGGGRGRRVERHGAVPPLPRRSGSEDRGSRGGRATGSRPGGMRRR
jgi:hypothetical protein